MRAVLQRVSKASVTVDDQVVGSIASGWLVLLGVGQEDEEADAHYVADKILNIRGFSDNDGKMNLSVTDIGGSVLLVSQFTLWGDCRKGRRPGFSQAAPPARAQELYHLVRDLLQKTVPVETGTFQAHMEVALVNDGPVTLLIDSKKTF